MLILWANWKLHFWSLCKCRSFMWDDKGSANLLSVSP